MFYFETAALDLADVFCGSVYTGVPAWAHFQFTEKNGKLPNQFSGIPCKNYASVQTF